MLFFDYTVQIVLCGVTFFGAIAGALGSFVFLRQQSLLGDAIAHASLPGLVGMFLLTHSNVPFVLLCGGACTGLLGVGFMHVLLYITKLKKDAIIGIVLSVFFGCGLVLLTVAQKYPISNQSVLNKFLFGNASTLLLQDLYGMGAIALLVCIVLCLFWKEFKLLTFDKTYAVSCGYNIHALEIVFSFLLVSAIVIGLQTVGVVLMSSMLIAPAVAARQWTRHLHTMVFLSAFFGVSAGIIGVLISSIVHHVPTGPVIVVVASGIVLVSCMCAPRDR